MLFLRCSGLLEKRDETPQIIAGRQKSPENEYPGASPPSPMAVGGFGVQGAVGTVLPPFPPPSVFLGLLTLALETRNNFPTL